MKELWTKSEASFDAKYLSFPALLAYSKPAHSSWANLSWRRRAELET
jgi:hypothetical protein